MIIQSLRPEEVGAIVTRTIVNNEEKTTIVTAMVMRECTRQEFLDEIPGKIHYPEYNFFYEVSTD